MNPKIKELAEQALVEHCVSHTRLQEFANLIIQECIDIAQDTRSSGDIVANRIRFVFGETDESK